MKLMYICLTLAATSAAAAAPPTQKTPAKEEICITDIDGAELCLPPKPPESGGQSNTNLPPVHANGPGTSSVVRSGTSGHSQRPPPPLSYKIQDGNQAHKPADARKGARSQGR